MSRTPKPRTVCQDQICRTFVTGDGSSVVELATDELEAIRLADLEGLEQGDASKRMGVSRGTLQRLLYSARRKTAFALVTGRSLVIREAPNVRGGCCVQGACRFCPRKMEFFNSRGVEVMKIAVTSENNQVFQHFGHTPEFTIFDVSAGKITNVTRVSTGETGHGALAGLLAELGVNLLLCGGIGGGAQMALAEAGISLLGGTQGDVTQVVEEYLRGELQPRTDFTCHHHEHEQGHSCGGHGHGNCGGKCSSREESL
ncbi:MAG: NifB/NifX family molybdenum-iron cluster-binding protein [Planctomycetia bacterium]|nr:NifB/NifX family molybdenum-iron cluster-binding protein [Planctomycetia bacterium]